MLLQYRDPDTSQVKSLEVPTEQDAEHMARYLMSAGIKEIRVGEGQLNYRASNPKWNGHRLSPLEESRTVDRALWQGRYLED